MGMYNAIIDDELLNPLGIYKERLSQSALVAEMNRVGDDEAAAVKAWLDDAGLRVPTSAPTTATELTEAQVTSQFKMYIAALRIADDFGLDAVGIQYQQGLKDVVPASDLAEGLLNNVERPPVRSRDGVARALRRRAAAALQRGRRGRRRRRAGDQPDLDGDGLRPGDHAPRRPLGRRLRRRVRVGVRDLRLGAGVAQRRLRPARTASASRRCTSRSAAGR